MQSPRSVRGPTLGIHMQHCQGSSEAHGGAFIRHPMSCLNIMRDVCRLGVLSRWTPIPWRPTQVLRPWGASCAVALPPALLGQISWIRLLGWGRLVQPTLMWCMVRALQTDWPYSHGKGVYYVMSVVPGTASCGCCFHA